MTDAGRPMERRGRLERGSSTMFGTHRMHTTDDTRTTGGGRRPVGRRALLLGSGTIAATLAFGAVPAFAAGNLKVGSKGQEVTDLQNRLNELGYHAGAADGSFGASTKQAVYAIQKAAGLNVIGSVGPKTRHALDVGHQPERRVTSGTGIEVDLARQLLIVTNNGGLAHTFNTSTGSGERYRSSSGKMATATTPTGDFSIFCTQSSGWQTAPLGRLYRPAYFHEGYAVHGSNSIPTHPASHGCARVSVGAMDLLWNYGYTEHGLRVLVY